MSRHPMLSEKPLKTTVRTPTKPHLVRFSECGARLEGAQCNGDTSQGSASLLEGFEAPKQRVLRAKCSFFTLFGTRLGPGRDPAGTRVNRLREPLHPLWDGPAHRSVPHERRAAP